MWTVKGESDKVKTDRMLEMKSRLVSLKQDIREIVNLEVYFNSPHGPAGNHDVILNCTFNSWTDLELYQNHPAHLAVAEYIKNIRDSRAAIDYEF
jgi:hypothetical protein